MKKSHGPIAAAPVPAVPCGPALAQYGGGMGGDRRVHGGDTTGTSRTGDAPPGPDA
ncbi:hypothetical protein [Variovorax rhizosphaerae]|uniref:Uncharacterized protein n=1 Tax=Variovorax rhizosphaerae TaxID=1836200 RepID=A0ABU8WRR7_9BURK